MIFVAVDPFPAKGSRLQETTSAQRSSHFSDWDSHFRTRAVIPRVVNRGERQWPRQSPELQRILRRWWQLLCRRQRMQLRMHNLRQLILHVPSVGVAMTSDLLNPSLNRSSPKQETTMRNVLRALAVAAAIAALVV